jgi:hypothetical protein
MSRDLYEHRISEANRRLTIRVEASHRYFLLWRAMQGFDQCQELTFHQGPMTGAADLSGITNEALLVVVLDRLREWQKSPTACRENALAITKLEEALHWLRARFVDRELRGVLGTNER